MGNEIQTVRAAGGLLWKEINDLAHVLVVHRPHYDDWSFPKGKRDPGESDLECAVREVEEETGFTVVVGDCLPDVEYVDHRGRPKIVNYWVMTMHADSGNFIANDEVDEVRWLPLAEADVLLTYELDKHLLREFLFQQVQIV